MLDISTSYWKFRRARLAVKRPEYALLDLLMFRRLDNKGENISFFDRCKQMYRHGEYMTDRAFGKAEDFFRNLMEQPEKMIDESLRLKDKDWEGLDDGVDRSEANLGEEGIMGDKPPKFSRDIGPARRTDDGTRVWFNPDRPENRVKSNHVGPERQIMENTDPWPLAKPDEDKTKDKRDPFAIEDQRSEEERKESSQKSGTGGDGAKSGGSNVTSIDEARKKRDAGGKDSADKGAEKARKIAQDRAKKRRDKNNKKDDLEL